MTASIHAAPPLVETLWRADAPGSRALRGAVLALAGSAILALSSKITVPLGAVPMTMQPLALLLIGAAFGWRLGAATVLVYLAQGALGLPVFSETPQKGVGLAYMMGPTGGYLIGFVFAAAIAGWTVERFRQWPAVLLGMTAATAAIYLCGLPWLARFVPADQAFAIGAAPFLLADGLKIALATLAALGLGALARRVSGSRS